MSAVEHEIRDGAAGGATVRGFTILIAKVKEGSTLRAGQRSAAFYEPVLIGRGEHCGFRLPDRSVSHEHLRLSLEEEGGWSVENLSRRGATFVDGEPLEEGASRRVVGQALWLQLGRALLHAESIPETLPVEEQISLPDLETPLPPPLLAVRDTARQLEIWLGGRPLVLYPSAARLLAALAARPAELVTYDELARAVDPDDPERAGGLNFAQLVTYARDGFQQAVEAGQLTHTELLEALHPRVRRGEESLREILRRVLENVRGVGYRLNLRAATVSLLEASDPAPRPLHEGPT